MSDYQFDHRVNSSQQVRIEGGPPTLSPIALLSKKMTNIAENGPKTQKMLKIA
jgi:hypothetical protein